MNTCDKQRRPWAKISELVAGDQVQVDTGFSCIPIGAQLTVHVDTTQGNGRGLWIECSQGRHYLDGWAEDGEHCVGVYKV